MLATSCYPPTVITLLPSQNHSDSFLSLVKEEGKRIRKKTSHRSPMSGIVVVFDFDRTIVDCDSYDWVLSHLGPTDLFNNLLPTMPWIPLMDRMMKELHSQGKGVEEVAECLKGAPLDPHIVSAVKSAYALGCDLRVLSDANVLFIETVLKHQGILGCFSEICSNPSHVDEEGRITIFPYHDFVASSHGCSLCPPNMCKGEIIERIRASAFVDGKKQFIYLGDGKGDYCPSLKLSEGDFGMPRKNYPLWDLINSNSNLLKAEVHAWSNGEELERILLQLIDISNSANGSGRAESLSVDCKFQSTAMASHETLSKASPVPHEIPFA